MSKVFILLLIGASLELLMEAPGFHVFFLVSKQILLVPNPLSVGLFLYVFILALIFTSYTWPWSKPASRPWKTTGSIPFSLIFYAPKYPLLLLLANNSFCFTSVSLNDSLVVIFSMLDYLSTIKDDYLTIFPLINCVSTHSPNSQIVIM